MSSVDERDKTFQAETDMFAAAAVENLPASPQCLDSYKTAQSEDPICSQIIQYCLQGWPSKYQIAPEVKPYWMARETLTPMDGLLLCSQRTVVLCSRKPSKSYKLAIKRLDNAD